MQTNQETISTLMDGELGAPTESTLERVAVTGEDRDCWARYHLMGDVLRDRLVEVASPQFATQLRDQIADEPSILVPRKQRRRFARPLAGLAIAASVATLAVLGVQQLSDGVAGPIADLTVAKQVDAPRFQFAAVEEGAKSSLPDVRERTDSQVHSQRRLNSYLVKFNAQRSSLGVPGVNPHVRMIGFETR